MRKSPFTSNNLQLYSVSLFDQENKESFKQQTFKIYIKITFICSCMSRSLNTTIIKEPSLEPS